MEGVLAPRPAAAVEFIVKGTEVTAGCLGRRCANGEAGRDASSEVALTGVDGDEVVDVMFSSRGMVINCSLGRLETVNHPTAMRSGMAGTLSGGTAESLIYQVDKCIVLRRQPWECLLAC